MAENKLNIYQKINKVKQAIAKAGLKKSGKNAFAKFEYYELSDFLPSIIEECDKIGLFNHITFRENEAELEIINCENPEEKITYISPITELELKWCNKIQALGGVQTYSRRYLYITAYDICENDSFDAVTGDGDKNQEKKKTTQERLEEANKESKEMIFKGFKERVESLDPKNTEEVNKILEEARRIYPHLLEEQKKECEEIILWIKELAWIK